MRSTAPNKLYRGCTLSSSSAPPASPAPLIRNFGSGSLSSLAGFAGLETRKPLTLILLRVCQR